MLLLITFGQLFDLLGILEGAAQQTKTQHQIIQTADFIILRDRISEKLKNESRR